MKHKNGVTAKHEGLIKLVLQPGKIYVLRNPAFKDMVVKVGRTIETSEQRAQQLSSVTGVPLPYEVLYEEDVVDCKLAEKLIHEKLNEFRINKRREFFQLPLKLAVKAVFEVCLHVNKPILAEVSRLVINLNVSKANELATLIRPFKGGKTRVYIIYKNVNGKVEIELGDNWLLDCAPELLVSLEQKKWVSDFYLVTAIPEFL